MDTAVGNLELMVFLAAKVVVDMEYGKDQMLPPLYGLGDCQGHCH